MIPAAGTDMERTNTRGRVRLRVRENEVDPYRIAHHSNYGVWAEIALQDFLRDGDGCVPPYRVVRFQCKYMLSALLDDLIEASVRPAGTADGTEKYLFQVTDCKTHRTLTSGKLEIAR